MGVFDRFRKKETQFKDLSDTLPVAGPIEKKMMAERPFDLFAIDDYIDPEILANHLPEQSVRALDPQTFKALSAKQLMKQRSEKIMPHIYANPMQHIDYRIYETLLKHTFIGALADAFIRYLIGTGFKPELELINPSEGNEEENQKLIKANQNIITDLLAVDEQIDTSDADHIEETFQEKVAGMIMSTLMFNRGALIFIKEKPVVVNGKQYPKIPSHLIPAHAQDLGMIQIDQKTRTLKGVQWRHSFEPWVPVSDMIYLWNPMTSSKVHNSRFYGTSILSPMISASKLLRQLLSNDFPAMATATWAGLYLLVVKGEGQTQEAKRREYEAISKGFKPGKPCILVKDPADVTSFDIKFDPKIAEFHALFESMVKLCISVMGLPQVGFYDEAAANRATMVGKIQLTLSTTIEPMREWIGRSITRQWYQPIYEMLYEGDPVLKKFKIKLSWNNLNIDEWFDKLEAALELDARQKLKTEEFGEMIGLDNYSTMVDPEAEVNAGGQPKKMSMDDGKGNQMDIRMRKGDKNRIPRNVKDQDA